MPGEIFHSIILVLTITSSFLLTKIFSQYDLQITALIFIIYFLGKKNASQRPKNRSQDTCFKKPHPSFDAVIFTLIILNIINSTGGIKSPFFFLNYFLIFALSLILEPVISITATLTLAIFYLLSLPPNQSLKELLPIFSLPFLTPFALLLGQEQIKIQKLKIKNQKLREETFLFLALVLKNHLKNIKEAVENFMGDQQLEIIRKNTRRMEKLIERYEKKS